MFGDIKNAYFEWMCKLIFPSVMDRRYYQKLLNALDNTNFKYLILLDENRKIDGINLRYRFSYENNISNDIMEEVFNMNECSVLEMMVALSLKCDEQIMFDSDIGSRINIWFFEMLKNLDLDSYVNYLFDWDLYFQKIERFLNREYEWNGKGGLFIVNGKGDIRNVEIWYQLCWFLNENFKD